ncbi:MAG: hypothetical protein MUP70_10615 [Candidatus Aminicenantes bacterium]|nr:hypothetical protein [Candidatus Aminicenantes bacterium]
MPHQKKTLTIILIPLLVCGLEACRGDHEGVYLKEARKAAGWIQASVIERDSGSVWPAVPGEETTISTNLYSGAAGTILFFLEMFSTTGEQKFLESAEQGSDYLLAELENEEGSGLYVGLSGMGFALQETYKAGHKERFREGFIRCLERLKKKATVTEEGVSWGAVTDIISGNTGTGLFLLFAAEETEDSSWIDLAVAAGHHLIFRADETDSGLKWTVSPEFPQAYPNFSHGTAGTAYFLSCLYEKTGQQEFLEAALKGAKYLLSIADTADNGCLIFHHEPDGENLFYLGWCHGPVGTSRLFYKLYQITQETTWRDWMEKGARSLLQSGIPEKETPGFWNNAGVCCGTAGVADYFLSLHKITLKREYLDFAKKLTGDLISKMTESPEGSFWLQAEHRSRPDFLQAQTGLMQGAAGIGLWFLRLDAFNNGRTPQIVLPDTPFE